LQAVILAGGLGTRLRPLTNTVPKPLIPIVDTPMVEYIISSLPEEVTSVIMAVSYMQEALERYFSETEHDVQVHVVNEEEPLGTGGAIKNVESYLEDTFLVFNGDVIASLDIERLLAFHRSTKGIGTIALWKVEDPSRYGVVDLDAGSRILKFLEKVPREEAPSDLINAGVYVLEPAILDHMEPGKRTSIEREVFPKVIEKGLYGHHFTGHWVDAGTPASFLEAQGIVLRSKGSFIEGTIYIDKATINDPVFISEGCTIGEGAVIGPNVFLGKNAHVGRGCDIKSSTVLEGCVIGDDVDMKGSLIGAGSKVEGPVTIDGKVIGYGEEVGPSP
jgi:mannose-1-phosphate guanylyltransferase